MQTPLVSIIIPTRNAEKTVARAIESVLNQTYERKELLIIDGGSTDNTNSIITSFNGRITYRISEPDNGIYDGINKGIAKSKGDWIYILGADDYLAANDVLQRIFESNMTAQKIIMGVVKNENAQHGLVQELHVNSLGNGILWRNTLHQQGVLYHCNIFQSFVFDTQLKVLADYDLHLKLWNEEVAHLPVDIIIAICNAQGISKKFNWALYKEELSIKKRRLNVILFAINIPFILMKYLIKNVAG